MTLKLWNVDDFLNHKFERPPRLVDPIIPNTGDVLFHAKRGNGKTLVAWDLAIAVATGGLFLGQFQCRKGKVAIVEVDMPDEQFFERIAPAREAVAGKGLPLMLITTDGAPTNLMLGPNGKFRKAPDKAFLDLAKLKPDTATATILKIFIFPPNNILFRYSIYI